MVNSKYCTCSFKERNQRVRQLGRKESPSWPPVSLSEDKDGSVMLSQCTFKIPIGNTDCQVRFNIYDRVKQEVKPPTATKTDNMSSATNGNGEGMSSSKETVKAPADVAVEEAPAHGDQSNGEGMSSSKETEKAPAVVAVEEAPAHGDQSQMTDSTATLEMQE